MANEYGYLTFNYTNGSNTQIYGNEITPTEDITIVGLRGYTVSAKTGSLRIGTTSAILQTISNVSFTAKAWTEAQLTTPINLTAGTTYIVQVVVDSGSGTIAYTQNSGNVSINSKISNIGKSRYGGFPGTQESNVWVGADIVISENPSSGTKYLFGDDSGKIYKYSSNTFVDTGLTEQTLTSAYFLSDGNDDIPIQALLTLTNPKVYKWSDEAFTSLTATLTAIPYPQTIISEAIDLTDSTITGVEGITATCEGNPTFAVSLDGTTWKMWNNSTNQWATLSDDTSGMSASVMADITSTVWNTFIGASTEFYIRFALLQTTDKVTNVTVDFTN